MKMLKEFVGFAAERWAMHVKRAAGKPAPWTKDPILQRYRFCNVRREDDRVTRWLHEHWMRPHQDDPDVWFAMYVARVFNLPSTLERIGYPVPWSKTKRKHVRQVTCKLGALPVFNGAYIVSTNGVAMDKVDYYLDVFDQLWAARAKLRPVHNERLATIGGHFMAMNGLGTFMSAQVLADIKWTPLLLRAPDWFTFATSGPGSRRGLSRVEFGELGTAYSEREWHQSLLTLRDLALPKFPKELRNLDAQNLQNCLCEFDKYQRAVEGGRPKQNFKPSEDTYV
jgi:hypothetical protein